MTLKIPPPPSLPKELGPFGQQLNRWLLEIQSILNSSGGIDPGNVDGLNALVAQVAAQALQITANTANIAANTANIATNTANIATNTAAIATNTAAIAAQALLTTALQARNQILNGAGVPGVGLGNNGDLYLNNTGGAGTRLYGKIGGAWVVIA